MKKKLNANAIVLDLRRLTEETLSAYEDISLNEIGRASCRERV